jgi:hypothetical protein
VSQSEFEETVKKRQTSVVKDFNLGSEQRGRRGLGLAGALSLGLGLAALALPTTGCSSDPQNGGNDGTGGTVGTGGGGGGGGAGGAGGGMASCETMAVNKVFKDKCGTCHSSAGVPIGKPDLVTPGYTQLMLDQPASFYAVLPAQMPACPQGVKIIDKAAPANSWFVKKLKGDVMGCGSEMPQAPYVLTMTERMEVSTYLGCVLGGAPVDLTPGASGGSGSSGGAGGGGAGGGGAGGGGAGGGGAGGGGSGGM